MRVINNLHIQSKLLLIVFVAFMGMAVISWVSLSIIKQELLAGREMKTQQLIDVGYGLIARYESEVTAGVLSEQQAKEGAIAELRTLRYGEGDYFFIIDYSLHMVMHPLKPEMEGKDISAMADATGGHMFQEMLKVVKKDGAGFHSYLWAKPGVAQPVQKLSYVKGFAPWGWIVGTGIYMDDVDNTFREQAITSGCVALVIAALVIASSLLISSIIARPLRKATESMKQLASGNSILEITDTDRRDEVGDMARSLKVFKENAIEKMRMEEEQQRARKAQEDRLALMNRLTGDFESDAKEITTTVASAATELFRTAENMKRTVTTVSSDSGSAASASEHTSTNVQGVASGIEQMSASIKEIANQVTKSSTIVGEAVVKAAHADTTVQMLTEAVSQIGSISELIQNIAGQINLLALNATIESARAGDAGKGFAVVASEVKSLATQTSKATDDIAKQIENVRNVSTEVANSLKDIQGAITNVNQYSSGIASAVEEQSAATMEMSSNMQQAAQGVANINASITAITMSATDADAGAAEVLNAAKMLSEQAEKLNAVVKGFLTGIKAQ